jgi:LPXTG-motif cell wall-anchored protein
LTTVGDTTTTDPSTTSSDEVAGTVITTTPTNEVDDLPLTGDDAGMLIGLAVVLAGLGIALLTMTRRPTED